MNQYCRVCSVKTNEPISSGMIFGNAVNYFECTVCGYVQTEHPYWLEKAYSSAINNCDTGIMARNQLNVGLVLATLNSLKSLDGMVVDYAGGYGILVRLLREEAPHRRAALPRRRWRAARAVGLRLADASSA